MNTDEIDREKIITNAKKSLLYILFVYVFSEIGLAVLSMPEGNYWFFLTYNIFFLILMFLAYTGIKFAAILINILSIVLCVGACYLIINYFYTSLHTKNNKTYLLAIYILLLIKYSYISINFLANKNINKYFTLMKIEKEKRDYDNYIKWKNE